MRTAKIALDEAHRIAMRAFAADPVAQELTKRHGDTLYSSILIPTKNEPRWQELILLPEGDARYIDDPRGSSRVLAKCFVDPLTGACSVEFER